MILVKSWPLAIGDLLQAALRNPIADPGIIGVSAGANLFSVIAALMLPSMFVWRLGLGLVGSLLVFVLLFMMQKKMSPEQLIIAGVALNAVLLAIQEIISPNKTMASLATSNWTGTFFLAILGIATLIVVVFFMHWANFLKVSDEELRSLGVNPGFVRKVLLFLAVVLAATATVSVGIIAFIAIIVPHISRFLVGHDYRHIIPFSFFGGSLVLLFTDSIGRVVVLPNEIPATTILAVIGGPFLIYLLARRGHVND